MFSSASYSTVDSLIGETARLALNRPWFPTLGLAFADWVAGESRSVKQRVVVAGSRLRAQAGSSTD